jgi:hypothetical protein
MSLRTLCLALSVATVLAAPSALAGPLSAPLFGAPSPKDRAEARRLASQAQVEVKAKNWEGAIKSLQQSVKLDPSAATRLELAKALTGGGRLVEAAKLLDELAAEPAVSGPQKALAKKALDQRTVLEGRIPKLKLRLEGEGSAGVTVKLDGEVVDPSSEIPVDPGEHELVVKGGGVKTQKRELTLAEGETKSLTLTLEAEAAAGPAPEPEGQGGGPAVAPAVVAFAVGVAGFVVGGVFGQLAFDEADKLRGLCPNGRCSWNNDDAVAARDTSIVNGNISTAGFVVGGVGIATGAVVLIVTSVTGKKKATPEATPSAFVRPYVGPGELGLWGRF